MTATKKSENNVDKINSISEKISLLNKEINQIETGTGVEAQLT